MYLQLLQIDEFRCVQLFCPICGAEKEEEEEEKCKITNTNVFSTLSEPTLIPQ